MCVCVWGGGGANKCSRRALMLDLPVMFNSKEIKAMQQQEVSKTGLERFSHQHCSRQSHLNHILPVWATVWGVSYVRGGFMAMMVAIWYERWSDMTGIKELFVWEATAAGKLIVYALQPCNLLLSGKKHVYIITMISHSKEVCVHVCVGKKSSQFSLLIKVQDPQIQTGRNWR